MTKSNAKALLTLSLICSLITIGYSSILHAEDSKKGDPATDPFWHRFVFFVGGDGGYHYLDTDAPAELNKNGFQFDAKGLFSYSWTDWTADVGGGWLYNNSSADSDTGVVAHDEVTVEAGFVRAAGRYRFTPRWELGLLNHLLFGADARFQTTSPISDHVSWLIGPEAVYRLPLKYPVQFSAAFLTDATISDRQIYQVLLGVQLGFPLGGLVPAPTPTPTPEPTPTPTPEPTVVPTPLPTPTPIVVTMTVPVRTYSFDIRPIQFDFNSAKIRPASLVKIEKLGTFLAQNPNAWEKLEVEGHTDKRGTAEYNLKLSQQRAESVRKALVGYGVPEERISAKGYGFAKPKVEGNTQVAWQKNRRVDFTLEGIKEPDKVDAFFRQLNVNY